MRDTGYRFITVTPATHERVNRRPGNERAQDLAGVFGWSRPFDPAILPPGLFELMQRAEVVAEDARGWRSRSGCPPWTARSSCTPPIRRAGRARCSSAPTPTASPPPCGPSCAPRRAPVRRAVDIGCGAGPGGILVAKARPEAEVLMVDINDEALRFARVNAALAGAANAVPRRSDLLSAVEGAFDLIIANPPYLLDPARRAYRHGGGRLGEGLSLAILDAALGRLAPGGTLLLYTGVAVVNGRDAFRSAAEERLASSPGVGWTYREVDPDVFGEELDTAAYAEADRIAAVVLTATRQG